MITIRVGSKNNIDFANEIEMNSIQKEKFVELLRECNFHPIEFVELQNLGKFSRQRLNCNRVQWQHSLGEEEMFEQLGMNFSEHFTGRLGRSGNGELQRGDLFAEYFDWIKEKKDKSNDNRYDANNYRNEDLRKEFIHERKEEEIRKADEKIEQREKRIEEQKLQRIVDNDKRKEEKEQIKKQEENELKKKEFFGEVNSKICRYNGDVKNNPSNNLFKEKLKREIEKKEQMEIEWINQQVPEELK